MDADIRPHRPSQSLSREEPIILTLLNAQNPEMGFGRAEFGQKGLSAKGPSMEINMTYKMWEDLGAPTRLTVRLNATI